MWRARTDNVRWRIPTPQLLRPTSGSRSVCAAVPRTVQPQKLPLSFPLFRRRESDQRSKNRTTQHPHTQQEPYKETHKSTGMHDNKDEGEAKQKGTRTTTAKGENGLLVFPRGKGRRVKAKHFVGNGGRRHDTLL